MSFKLTKQEVIRYDAICQELKIREQDVSSEFRRLLNVLEAVTNDVNLAIRARNGAVANAEEFAKEIGDRLSDEWNEKSER